MKRDRKKNARERAQLELFITLATGVLDGIGWDTRWLRSLQDFFEGRPPDPMSEFMDREETARKMVLRRAEKSPAGAVVS